MYLSQAVSMDYMGAAEFEFGALPKSLRFMDNNVGAFQVVEVPEIRNAKEKPLFVWAPSVAECPIDPGFQAGTYDWESKTEATNYAEFWEQYRRQLIRLRAGELERDLHEASHFNVQRTDPNHASQYFSQPPSTDFWWDIENHVMWSFHEHFMKKELLRRLQNSCVRYRRIEAFLDEDLKGFVK